MIFLVSMFSFKEVDEASGLLQALWLDCKGCNITETVRSSAADLDDFTYVAGNLPVSKPYFMFVHYVRTV
jgi:hypothetical protein